MSLGLQASCWSDFLFGRLTPKPPICKANEIPVMTRATLSTLALFLFCTLINGDAFGQQKEKRQFENIRVVRDLPYVTDGHERQQLDLYLPENATSDKLPLVVFVHGGGWQNGTKAGGKRFLEPLVSTGEYVGASINYRLSQHAIWPAQIHDCKAAIRWLRSNAKEYGIDHERIGVMGTSAGGHLVAMLGTAGGQGKLEGTLGEHLDQSSRVNAVINFYGPTELLTMNDFPGKMDHNAPDSPESKLIGGPIQELKAKTNIASPIHYVSADDSPFLIFHGTEDPLVPFEQSSKFDALLDKAGVSSTLITIQGGGHGRFQNSEINEIMSKFWKQQLQGKEIFIPEVVLKEPRR